jgi:hypothetical protein
MLFMIILIGTVIAISRQNYWHQNLVTEQYCKVENTVGSTNVGMMVIAIEYLVWNFLMVFCGLLDTLRSIHVEPPSEPLLCY